MRIAFVDYKLNLRTGGGSNGSIHQTASALVELGHDVSVITLMPERNACPPGLPYDVIEAPIPRAEQLPGRLAVVSLLRKWERHVDLFQVESPSLILSAALYRWLGGRVPVVVELHLYSHFCTNLDRMDADCCRHCSVIDQLRHRDERPARKILLAPLRVAEYGAKRLLANKVDRFIAVSPVVGRIHAWNGLDPRKIATIYTPIDLAALQRARRPDLAARAREEPYRILYVGRLESAKGVDVLLEALTRLDFPFDLDVVGDGQSRDELERLADGAGLASRVHFRGWVAQDDTVAYYSRADLFVHPGRWPEPAGRTVMEAMALGVPVLVSDVGGPPVVAGEGGRTFRANDPGDLCDKIAMFRDDPALAARLAAAGRRRARQFDRQRSVRQLLDLYAEICPQRGWAVAPADAER